MTARPHLHTCHPTPGGGGGASSLADVTARDRDVTQWSRACDSDSVTVISLTVENNSEDFHQFIIRHEVGMDIITVIDYN